MLLVDVRLGEFLGAIMVVFLGTAMAGVPTVAEAGFPGYEAMTWIALFAPKGMNSENLNKLSERVNSILAEDSFKKSVAAKGLEAVGSTPEALQHFLAAESRKWRAVIQLANIKLD